MKSFEKVQGLLPGVPALTPKQRRFVDEYMLDLNIQAAMRRAGYACRNQRNQFPMRSEAVRAAIDERFCELRERNGHMVDRVVEELARIAFEDPRALAEWGPDGVRLRPSDSLSPEQAAAVSEVISDRHGGVRLKKHDKVRALELLGRYFGMFTDRVQAEVSGPGGAPLREDKRIVVQFVPAPKGEGNASEEV